MSEDRSYSKAQFASLGAVTISLILISGISIAYTGLSGYQDRNDRLSDRAEINDGASAIELATAEIMVERNQNTTINSYSDREDKIKKNINDYMDLYGGKDSEVTGFVNHSIRGTVSGYRIVQTNTSENMTNPSGGTLEQTWTAFDGARDARQATFVYEKSSLPGKGSNPPGVIISSGGSSTTLKVYRESSGIFPVDRVTLVKDGTDVCTFKNVSRTRINVDYLRGEVNGAACSDVRTTDPVEKIEVISGTSGSAEVNGTFSMTYYGTGLQGDIQSDSSPPKFGEAVNPTGTKIVYATVMDVRLIEQESAITRPIILSPGKHQKEVSLNP